jgi:hypothetical protein
MVSRGFKEINDGGYFVRNVEIWPLVYKAEKREDQCFR